MSSSVPQVSALLSGKTSIYNSGRLTLDAALVTTDDDGSEELIPVVVAVRLVSCLDSSDGVFAGLALAQNEALESDLDALPSLIAVHGVVSANNGGNLAKAKLLDEVDQLLHVTGTGLGVGITAVAEEVDEDLGDIVLLGGLEEGVQVLLLRVLCSVLVCSEAVRHELFEL